VCSEVRPGDGDSRSSRRLPWSGDVGTLQQRFQAEATMCADAVDCVVVELRCSERQHVLTTYLPPTASGPAADDIQMASTPAKQPTEVT